MKKSFTIVFALFMALSAAVCGSPAFAATGSLTELQQQITAAIEGETITLTQDYEYKAADDNALKTGVVIDKTITIDGKGYTVSGKNQARLLSINAGTKSVTIKNLTVTEGWGTSGNSVSSASALLVSASSGGKVVFENCVFSNSGSSMVSGHGASAIRINTGADVTFKNCEISNNRVTQSMDRGGGITTLGNVKFYGCVIKNNHGEGRGGGLYVDNGQAYMEDCDIIGNTGVRGGGINVSSSNNDTSIVHTFKNCLIKGNTADPHFSFSSSGGVPGDAGNGGGVLAYRSKVHMENCKIIDNTAKRGGGVGVDISGTTGVQASGVATEVTLVGCEISGNRAIYHPDLIDDVFYGGGLTCLDGSQSVQDITAPGTAILSNNTIINNFVVGKDGARWMDDVHIHWSDNDNRQQADGTAYDKRYDGSIESSGNNRIGTLINPKQFTRHVSDIIDMIKTQLPKSHEDEILPPTDYELVDVEEIKGEIIEQLRMGKIGVITADTLAVLPVFKDDGRLSKEVEAKTSAAIFINQPIVEEGGAVVIGKNLIFLVKSESLTGEDLHGDFTVMKYFDNDKSIDLLAKFGDKLFDVKENAVTLKKILVVVDEVYRDPEIEVHGHERCLNAGVWLTEDYFYVFDGKKDGFARDPIALEIVDSGNGNGNGNGNVSSGSGGCDAIAAGVFMAAMLALISLPIMRKNKK